MIAIFSEPIMPTRCSSEIRMNGSPTINGDAVKPIHDLLSSLATISLKGKLGAALGSYGY